VLELLAGDDAVSGGSRRNRGYAETFTTFGSDVEEARRRLVCDATTSGGLLVALAPAAAPSLPGPIVAGEPGAISVR
jgi:selenide,water dikinase